MESNGINVALIEDQLAYINLTLETEDEFETYGGTMRGQFEFQQTGVASWRILIREAEAVSAPLRMFTIYAREKKTGREWVVLKGKIIVSARTAAVPADKLAPVEYFVTVPVVDHDVDAVGSTIVQGIPGPKGDKGDPGPPGEGGMTEAERATLAGAAQRGGANTFTAANTFTGSVDMSTAQVTPPSGWNVGELTAEQVQSVVPIAWGNNETAPSANSIHSIAIGNNAKAAGWASTALGTSANAELEACIAIGHSVFALGKNAITIGNGAQSERPYSLALGCYATVKKTGNGEYDGACAITLGHQFSDTAGSYTCTTQGTGSITIGAGANTLNNGDTESSNSVTIGCKASNQGADSVVIGAQASGTGAGIVAIGVGAEGTYGYGSDVVIGKNAKGGGSSVIVGSLVKGYAYQGTCVGYGATIAREAVALGHNTKAGALGAIALGRGASTNDSMGIALGYQCNSADAGAVVIASWDESRSTKTQLYFSGANTPLANTYHGGAPMLGYVTKDRAGNIVAAGTRSLIDLLTDNSTFAPASLDENGEWVMPRVFHPSDLDLPSEEPSEPEEYTPLPVYPIVEPEVDELRTPTQEI